MKKSLFLMLVVFILNLLVVFSVYADDNSKIKASNRLTTKKSRVIDGIKNTPIIYNNKEIRLGERVKKMAGSRGKVKWDFYEEDLSLVMSLFQGNADSAPMLSWTAEVTVETKDEEGVPHIATFSWISIGGNPSTPLLILDGRIQSAEYMHRAIITGDLFPPDE